MFSACLVLLLHSIIQAAPPLKTWNGSVNNLWNVSGNWTPAGVPAAADSVVIPSGKTVETVINTSFNMRNLRVSGTLVIVPGSTLEVVSPLSSIAVRNSGTFTNNGTLNVKSGFHGIYNSGPFTNGGTLNLGTEDAMPYAFREEAFIQDGFFTNLSLTNLANAVINIRRPANNGILSLYSYSRFSNAGTINITEIGLSEDPVVASTGDGIDIEEGAFTNEAGGAIYISQTSANGLYCRSGGTFTNKGLLNLIDIGITPELAFREGIFNEGSFENTATGQISIEDAHNNGLVNYNSFTNRGAISIGQYNFYSIAGTGLACFSFSPVSVPSFTNAEGGSILIKNTGQLGMLLVGIYQPASFTNAAGATLSMGNITGDGLFLAVQAGFNNYGSVQIGLIGGVGGIGINNSAQVANQQGAEILIQHTGGPAIKDTTFASTGQYGSFKTAGRVVISNMQDASDPAILNVAQGNFENLGCKALLQIDCNNAIQNLGTFSNSGNIIERAAGNSSITSNSGSIQNLNGGNFAVTGANTGLLTTADGILWTGCFDSNWNADYNWNTVSVPTTSDAVAIPDVTIDPILAAAVTGSAQSVKVLSGGVLTIAANGTLDLNGSESYSLYNLGTVNNNGLIKIGQSAAAGAHGVRNNAAFNNNTGAEIRIDRLASSTYGIGIGLWNEGGTFVNNARIRIGDNEEVGPNGLYNAATFQNNSGAELYIQRAETDALANANGTFTNTGSIAIGNNAGAGACGITNRALFYNNVGGSIAIDATYSEGLRNSAGTFNNAASIVIGATYGVGNHGLMNDAIFNHNGGEIRIGRSTYAGLRIGTGTFNSAARIVIGGAESPGEHGVMVQGNFVNNGGGELYLDRASKTGIYVNNGEVRNSGKIIIGSGSNSIIDGIRNQTRFFNLSGSEIRIDRTSNTGIWNEKYFSDAPAEFNNSGSIALGTAMATGLHGIYNSAFFYNKSGGNIQIDRAGNHGITNVRTFNNEACAAVRLLVPLNNTQSFTNRGLLSVNTALPHLNSGTLVNEGILEYPQDNAIPNVTDPQGLGVVVQPVTGECFVMPMLQKGAQSAFTAGTTWYANAGQTAVAGTYDNAGNAFTVSNLTEGATHTLYFNVQGANNSCSFPVSLRFTYDDATPPILGCPSNRLALASDPATCVAVVQNTGATAYDLCTAVNFSYSMSGATTRSGSGQVTNQTFNSGLTTVVYTASDDFGNQTNCQFTVTVPPCVNGRIIWKQDNSTGVKDVAVAIDGEQGAGTVYTNANGVYGLVSGGGSGFTITPSKDINKLNGVNAQDVFRLQQHLSGNVLTNPWQLIAADVNSNGTINSLDMSILQQAILGNPSALAQMVKSWRFVPTTAVLNNPPWGFPESISLTNAVGNQTGKDFYGVKVGDIAATYANPANQGQGLVLRAPEQVLRAGETLTVELSAGALSDINALQMALRFDPEQLQLAGIEPLTALPLQIEHFGRHAVAEGSLRLLWVGEQAVSIKSEVPLFRLRFATLESGARLSEVLQLDDAALAGLVYNSRMQAAPVALEFWQSTAAGQAPEVPGLKLEQNTPNPFVGNTTVHFYLPQPCEIQFNVYDALGRRVSTHSHQYEAGRHALGLELSGHTGPLYGELRTPYGAQTIKMTGLSF